MPTPVAAFPMPMRSLLPLAVMLVLSGGPPALGVHGGENGPTRFVAKCLFADPAFHLDALGERGLSIALEHHSACHGWRPEWSTDLAPPVPCPPEALAALEARIRADGLSPDFLATAVAIAFERNGRIDGALALLRDALSNTVEAEPRWHLAPPLAAAVGTRIAARHARHADVIWFAERWQIGGGCGNAMAAMIEERASFLAPALHACGRFDEFAGLVESIWSIDAEARDRVVAAVVRHAAECAPGVDLDHVAARTVAPLLGPRGTEVLPNAIALVRREREVETAPRRAPQDIESALTWTDALPRWWLLELGAAGRRELVERAERSFERPPRLLRDLADLGAPEVEEWVGRHRDAERYAYGVWDYERARIRWRALTGEATPLELFEERLALSKR